MRLALTDFNKKGYFLGMELNVVSTEPNLKKKFTEENARRHKNQKNTRGVARGYSFRRALR